MICSLNSSPLPLNQAYRVGLLDLDGVVYRGAAPVDYAIPALLDSECAGMILAYSTNNSSRTPGEIAEHLDLLGLSVDPAHVFTSSMAAARMVAEQVPAGARVLVVGSQHLQDEVLRQGLQVVSCASEQPAAVIQGWYPQLAWSDLAQVAYAVQSGALYFATNYDATIPREMGPAPGCGAMVQAVVYATGVAPQEYAGKPTSRIYDEALHYLHDVEGVSVDKHACLAIGDRLDTDIEAGNCGGYDSLLVLTGVCDIQMLFHAQPAVRPRYIAQDLRGLLESHPQPIRIDDTCWQCEDERAWCEQDMMKISRPDSMNALRAACCLAWSLNDQGRLSDFRTPLFQLS